MFHCEGIVDSSIGDILREYYEAETANEKMANLQTEKLNSRARKELDDMHAPQDDEEEDDYDDDDQSSNSDDDDQISITSSQRTIDEEHLPPDVSTAPLFVRVSFSLGADDSSISEREALHNTIDRELDGVQQIEIRRNPSGLEIRCRANAEAVIESVTVFAEQGDEQQNDDDGDDQNQQQQQRISNKRQNRRDQTARAPLQKQKQKKTAVMPPMIVCGKILEGHHRYHSHSSPAAAAVPTLCLCALGCASSAFVGEQKKLRLTVPKSSDLIIGCRPLSAAAAGAASSSLASSSSGQQDAATTVRAKRFTLIIQGVVRLYKQWLPDVRAAVGTPSLALRSSATRLHPTCISDDGTFPPTRVYGSRYGVGGGVGGGGGGHGDGNGGTRNAALVATTHNLQRIPLHSQQLRCLPILYTATCRGSLGAPPRINQATTPTPSSADAEQHHQEHQQENSSGNLVPCFVLDATVANQRTVEPRDCAILPAAERRRQREEHQRTKIDPLAPAAWSNLLAAPGGEIFERRYTPASASRTVNIRRFPHRNADIIGTIPFGAVAVATSIVHDPKDNEWYAEWGPQLVQLPGGAAGGYSRIRGALGPFLVQLWPGKETTILDPPRFFGVSGTFQKPVRVRCAPCLKTGVVVAPDLEVNEARAAVALHAGADDEFSDSVFVEWADGSGYSRKSGRYFAELQWQKDCEAQQQRQMERDTRKALAMSEKEENKALQRDHGNEYDDEEECDDSDSESNEMDHEPIPRPEEDVEERVFVVELPQIRSAIVALAKRSN